MLIYRDHRDRCELRKVKELEAIAMTEARNVGKAQGCKRMHSSGATMTLREYMKASMGDAKAQEV